MSQRLQLPGPIWDLLLQHPEQKIEFAQDNYRVEIRITVQDAPPTSAGSTDDLTMPSAEHDETEPSKGRSKLATNPELPAVGHQSGTVDPGLFVDEPPARKEPRPPTPKRIETAKPEQTGMKLELLDESSTQQDRAVRKKSTFPEQPPSDESLAHLPIMDVGFDLPKNTKPSSQPWGLPYRLLRTTDTPLVLQFLFRRLAVPVAQSIHLARLPSRGQMSSVDLAEAAGVEQLLSVAVPLSESPSEQPSYRLIGQRHDEAFVLLYQDAEQRLCFAPIQEDGGPLQIALQEGEELLTEEELTLLFQTNARFVGPEEAKQSALQLQEQLHQPDKKEASPEAKAPTMRPAVTQKHSTKRVIDVDQRFLKRLNFNRNHDDKHLWDNELQPGVAILRHSLATLYQDNKPVIEGVLICLIGKTHFMIFDRRSKRNVSLTPNTNQQIWIRRNDE